MKLKILSLVGVLSVIFIAAVIWRMNHFIHEDRTSWAQAQMRTQLLSLEQTTQAMIRDLQHRTPVLQEATRDKSFWLAMDPFKAMAWVRDLNHPTLENTAIKEGTGLDDTNLASAIKDLQGKGIGSGKFLLVPWKDSQNRNWLMVIWSWADRKLILWTGAEYLQALLETHKGTLAQLSFFNDGGQVLAHSQAEYFGTRVNDQYLFKDFKSSGASQGGGSFKDSSGEDLQGYYEAIPNTNVVMMASASYRDLLADKNKVWASFLFIGLGLVLFTLAGISLINFTETESAPVVAVAAPPTLRSESVTKPLVTQESRQDVFKKIAGSLGHEMRAPLARIFGFSQLLLEKQKGTEKDNEAAGYAESILREARTTRDTLEKLFSFAQEKESVMAPVKIDVSARNILQRLQGEMQKQKIQLIQNIPETGEIPADAVLLERALESVLQNSMDSVERQVKKEIQVTVQKEPSGIKIIVLDSGEGIAPGNLARIFDPFFTTRSYFNHLGLGLSAAYGVIKQHGGDIKVASQLGHGTKVTISFPEKETSKEPRPKAEMSPRVSAMETSEKFSPADVEIEKLLDFKDADELRADLAQQEMPREHIPFLDESRTIKTETIDKPALFTNKAPSILNDYKVEIRRPRSRTIENS